MYKPIPSVCEFLANEESIHSVRLLQYMELMESGRFPTTNICYRVFLDLVQWYSISKPSDMRYSPDLKEGGFALFGDLGFGTFKVGIWGFSVLSLGFGIGICPFLNWDLGI